MAGELSREMKRKIDAMERINKGDMSPSIFEGATGTQTIIDPTLYTQTFLPGKNITFGTSGDSKTINAVMNLFAGSNITITEPDANGQVTITGNIGGMDIDIADLVDGYVITWDETSQKFILAEAASPLAMATETTLGGIKAKDKTTETGEVAIDPATGKLFAPSSGGSGTYVAIGIVDGGDPDSTYEDVPIPGILPTGGTAGQIPSKIDGTDYNVEWVTPPSGGNTYANTIDIPPEVSHALDDEFDGPTLDAKWTWLNQIGSLVTLGDGKLRMSSPTSNGTATLVQPAPTGNFIITTKLDIVSKYENYHGGGLYLYNQTLNRAVSFIKQHRSDSFGHYLSCYRWADKAAVGTYQTIGYHGYPNYKYLRIRLVNGTLYCETTLDGVDWIPVYQESLATYLTAITHIGFGTYKIGALNILSIFDWFRVTES